MEAAAGGVAGAPGGPKPIAGEVTSREDAIRMLDKITDYFNRNEPSSPVPILLRRAKRLVSKSFMEIVKDLAPDGLSQVERIRGVEE
jgi:type VI secretion system protein ImpA